jgi:tetratricopeptide (TPR) repeat protein
MATSFQDHLDRGEQALDKFRNQEAVPEFEAALKAASLPHERALALEGLATIAFRNSEHERALELLDQAASACLPGGRTPIDGETASALAHVWHERGVLLLAMNRMEEVIETLDQSLSRFLDRVTSVTLPSEDWQKLRRTVARTLNTKGSALDQLHRLAESLECYEEVIRRFQDVDDLKLQRSVARAMRRRAWLFGHLGRQDKEIEGYDELFTRFGPSTDRQISETVLNGLETKMSLYRDQEDFETVIEICDQIIDRYRDVSYWPIADTVARTMVRQAVAFGRRGARNKELAAYDNVLREYGESSDPSFRIHGAKALMFKAVTLGDADEVSAEMECYDEVVRRYAEDPASEVRAVAADALIHKGMSLGAIAEDAAEDTGVREVDPEIACYDEVLFRYGKDESVHLKRAVAEALIHKSETLMDAGRTAEAAGCLDSLLAGYAAIDDRELREIVNDARALKAEI